MMFNRVSSRPWLGSVLLAALLTACASPTAVAPTSPAQMPTPASQEQRAAQETAPTAAPQFTAQQERVLVVGLPKTDIDKLDPGRQYEITPPQIIRAAYETLVTLPEKGARIDRVEPLLAESYDVSSDALVYTFKLREGVKFASGNPLTAEDVVFSFRRLGNLQDNPAWLYNDHVQSIEALDARTVRITLKEPNAAFLAMLVSPNFSVLDSKVVRQQGGTDDETAKETDKATEWLNNNSAGTGPYILKEWKRNEQVVLERNPNYWREPAFFDRIIFRELPDDAARQQAFERGDVDIAVGLDIDAIERLKSNPDVVVLVGNTLDMTYLAMTTNPEISPELADPRVRRAIALAIDYEGIIEGLMNGNALQLPSIIPLGLLGTDPNMALKRDVEQAKALLAEAGLANGFTAKMVYPGGYKFNNVLLADTLVAKVQEDLKEINVSLQVEPRDEASWRADYRAGKLAITLADWTPDFIDPHGWAPAFAVEGSSAARRVHYKNAEATALAQEAGRITDPAKRAEMYLKVQQILMKDLPFVGLIQPRTQIVVRKDLRGVVYNPVYFIDYYYVSR